MRYLIDCWDIVYKKGACEKFPNKTREYMKNFDKFGGFTNNQIKTIIFMLRTVTEDLDYALEVLLPEVIFFIIKDLFDISTEKNKKYMLDGGTAHDRRTVSPFRGEDWQNRSFFIFLMLSFFRIFL